MSLLALYKEPEDVDSPSTTLTRIPASLTSLPKELFQEIALYYALFCVSALDNVQKEILVPASLQAPLPAGCGYPGPHYDPMLKWQTRWQDEGALLIGTPFCTSESLRFN
ncbi:hypothetical protein PENSPDRAFT_693312 [Peniophora sp. CONT]|nr:hypothetical protein PENSPDRAFT_693312 [Peniophora sp. CONT]